MKKSYFILALCAVMSLSTLSCSSDDDPEPEQGNPPAGEDVNGGNNSDSEKASATGEVKVVTVKMEGAWETSSSEKWCVPAVKEGVGSSELAVNLLPNVTGAERTATVTVRSKTSGQTKADASEEQTYTFTQPAATTAEPECFITGLSTTPTAITVYLTVGGAESGMFKNVSGLSFIYQGDNSFLPGECKIPLGSTGSDSVTIVGPGKVWGDSHYGITGWDEDEGKTVLSLGTTPETKKKVYIDQSEVLHPIAISDEAIDDNSAQIRFALGDKVYFGGGYGLHGVNNSVMYGIQYYANESVSFNVLDTKTNEVKRLNNLPSALIYAEAVVIGGKAYAMSNLGELYVYSAADDKWSVVSEEPLYEQCNAVVKTPSDNILCINTDGNVIIVNTEGKQISRSQVAAGTNIVTLKENENRSWVSIDNTLWVCDAEGLRKVADYEGYDIMGAVDGKVYYRLDSSTVGYYSLDSNSHGIAPMFFYVNSSLNHSCNPHTGRPVMLDGKSYLLMCGQNVTMSTGISWTRTLQKRIMRIDFNKSYKVTVE
ncbi:MAG: BACON domain-containing protein [Prevotella sp.]